MGIASMLPRPVRGFARESYYRLNSLPYLGGQRQCACCEGSFRTFLPYGIPERANALCPRCGSRERHRLMWMFLEKSTDIRSRPLSVLHFAPEYSIERRLRSLPNLNYVTADLDSPWAERRVDITAIPFPDQSFDVILCSHVLEHIPDDRTAMSELFRVMKPNGWAILQVPLDPGREKTFEDPSVTDPRERERLFGQDDHVRLYGLDYAGRLSDAGFDVEISDFVKTFSSADLIRLGLDSSERIYVGRRSALA